MVINDTINYGVVEHSILKTILPCALPYRCYGGVTFSLSWGFGCIMLYQQFAMKLNQLQIFKRIKIIKFSINMVI